MNMDMKFSKIETEKCVYCAICVPKCPTYQLSSCETESPRGRVIAINQLLQGKLTINSRLKQTIYNCLQCGLCESACPAKIATPKLISIIKNKIPSKRYFLFLFFTRYSHVFSKLAPLLRLALPTSMKNVSKAVSTKELPQQKTVLFLGCNGEIFDSDTKNSSIELLKKINIGVRVSKRQYCCGSLHYHQGDFKSFAQLQDFNSQALNGSNKLLYLSSGCKLGIKAIAEKSAISAQNIIDFLFEQDFSKKTFKPLSLKVAVFIPCSHRDDDTKEKITALLKLIPQLKIRFITGSCCGSAGVHFFSKRSLKLRNQILAQIEDESLILTTNIGCRLHLARGVNSQNRLNNVKIIHPSFLLNQQCS